MLPTLTESVAALRARYSAAISRTFEVVDLASGRGQRPGESRDHVFDFEDGVRLIISRERFPSGEVVVHFSASVDTARVGQVGAEFLGAAVGHFREISMYDGPIRLIGISQGAGVPHWLAETEEALQ